MATLLLSAAGAAIGGGFGGSFLGLSGAVIGRAVGGVIGRSIDQRLLGSGSQLVETGRIDRFRLTGASEGAPVAQVWGRMRVAGQIIWASRFRETVTTTRSGGGGKGAPAQASTTVTEYSYSVSLALALCEGEILRVGRVWADGAEIAPNSVNMRVYTGSRTQLPDPKMEAVEGTGNVPAYRGIAYVVFEDLQLAPYGNRVPQFSVEVVRAAQGPGTIGLPDLVRGIRGVALLPGTGEYALAGTPVHYAHGLGRSVSANVHSPSGRTDFLTSLDALREELPNVGSVSLVVTWFGGDLRVAQCQIRPKVENAGIDGLPMDWQAGGISRAQAQEVARDHGRPVYGGTPADGAVIEAIGEMRARGLQVMFYPFVLMDQLDGNGLTDPWTGAADQPVLPWRGRITLSVAPGRAGTPDRTAAADAEVAGFFGVAQAAHFSIVNGKVAYSGPDEWSYRRFILHYATLCVLAGGVDAFCVGSELRGITQIRGAGDGFPAVEALRLLAGEVRAILGPYCKITYAADWSEFSSHSDGQGNLYFHLDPLWSDPAVDMIGIDNYLPLSDWRDGEDHADAQWGSLYSLDYLKANVEGGEYYDWYYGSAEEREAQRRTPITDGATAEPWVWRTKDLRGWWEKPHHNRIGGIRQPAPTSWVPKSKPIWFTEYGCSAIDKATNEPNKFLDPKSSESSAPVHSNGRRDDLIQMQYLRAVNDYWEDGDKNPQSPVYGGPMVDMQHAHVWAWDARPFPYFPNRTDIWADGANYARGHWTNGRTTAQPLSSVVAEICAASGLVDIDVSGLYGLVRGYILAETGTGRQALQPLMVAFGFEALERDGVVIFRMRDGHLDEKIDRSALALSEEDPAPSQVRVTVAEVSGRVRLSYVEAEGDFETRAVEAVHPGEDGGSVSHSELPLSLTGPEAQRIVERWLSEARVAQDSIKFALPPSLGHLGPGDVIEVAGESWGRFRIDRAERAGLIAVEAVRVETAVYEPSDEADARITPRGFVPPVPVAHAFLDLPLMGGAEIPHAPYVAVTADPWPGTGAVYSSDQDAGYVLNTLVTASAAMGETLSALQFAKPGLWDRGPPLRVLMTGGALASASDDQLLNGANLMAIGDGTSSRWELLQFRDAQLVAPATWDLSWRLRGQAGSDAVAPASWPAGSRVVLMNGAARQIALLAAERGLQRHYRIGPAVRDYADPSYTHATEAFSGIGLRPLSVCHLRARRLVSGDVRFNWVRRTRIDGDNWASFEVPLGEARELYVVRVFMGAVLQREVMLSAPDWTYETSMMAADGTSSQSFRFEVAQISDAFGAGPFRGIDVND